MNEQAQEMAVKFAADNCFDARLLKFTQHAWLAGAAAERERCRALALDLARHWHEHPAARDSALAVVRSIEDGTAYPSTETRHAHAHRSDDD